MIRKWLAALMTVLAVWITASAGAETTPPPFAPETPIPVRTSRPAPEPTPEMPEVINRIANPEAGQSFRFPMDAKILEIWFPNISNADEAVLIYDGDVWMIDCADETMGVRGAEMVRWLGIGKIDRIFNSHPHHDHLNGIQVTHEAAAVEELDICFPTDSTDHMIKALQFAHDNGIRIGHFKDGDTFSMGDGAVTLTFYVGPQQGMDMNNASAMTMVRYGERTILFTADTEALGQAGVAARIPAAELKADLIRYPHHGKKALDADFYEAVRPEIAIITNKEVPDWSGIKYLKARNVPCVYTSVVNVYLHLATDGEHWVVEYVPRDQEKPKGTQ